MVRLVWSAVLLVAVAMGGRTVRGEIVPASRASGGLAGAFDSRYRTAGVSKGGNLRSDLPRGSVFIVR